jgi:DNA polymerase sigma
MKLHKDLIKSKNFFAIHMRTKRIKLIDYFFFRRVFIVLTSNCFCEHSTNVMTHSTFLQRLIRESSAHAARRRNDEHEHISEYREKFKNLDHLIDENQFINSIFTD